MSRQPPANGDSSEGSRWRLQFPNPDSPPPPNCDSRGTLRLKTFGGTIRNLLAKE